MLVDLVIDLAANCH